MKSNKEYLVTGTVIFLGFFTLCFGFFFVDSLLNNGPTAFVTATARATWTPRPTRTPVTTATVRPTWTPRPTSTPTSTFTPGPSPTPQPTSTPTAALVEWKVSGSVFGSGMPMTNAVITTTLGASEENPLGEKQVISFTRPDGTFSFTIKAPDRGSLAYEVTAAGYEPAFGRIDVTLDPERSYMLDFILTKTSN